MRVLKTTSKTFEIEMMLKEIEQENQRLNDILYRLQENVAEELPYVLQRMKQEELISQEVVEKLLEKPHSLLEMIETLKETKSGAGVTQYLPSSSEEMLEKLAILIGEFSSGNSTVLPQIVALLGRLHQKREISYRDYKSFCNIIGTCPDY